jgi:hypothetical protein
MAALCLAKERIVDDGAMKLPKSRTSPIFAVGHHASTRSRSETASQRFDGT